MNECDQAYMQTKKRKPEPVKGNETYGDVCWYFLGSAIGFVFWIWFIVWFMRSAS